MDDIFLYLRRDINSEVDTNGEEVLFPAIQPSESGLLVTVRGVFLTLASLLRDSRCSHLPNYYSKITNSPKKMKDLQLSDLFVVQMRFTNKSQRVHVVCGTDSSGHLLVLAVPPDCSDLNVALLQWTRHWLHFCAGDSRQWQRLHNDLHRHLVLRRSDSLFAKTSRLYSHLDVNLQSIATRQQLIALSTETLRLAVNACTMNELMEGVLPLGLCCFHGRQMLLNHLPVDLMGLLAGEVFTLFHYPQHQGEAVYWRPLQLLAPRDPLQRYLLCFIQRQFALLLVLFSGSSQVDQPPIALVHICRDAIPKLERIILKSTESGSSVESKLQSLVCSGEEPSSSSKQESPASQPMKRSSSLIRLFSRSTSRRNSLTEAPSLANLGDATCRRRVFTEEEVLAHYCAILYLDDHRGIQLCLPSHLPDNRMHPLHAFLEHSYALKVWMERWHRRHASSRANNISGDTGSNWEGRFVESSASFTLNPAGNSTTTASKQTLPVLMQVQGRLQNEENIFVCSALHQSSPVISLSLDHVLVWARNYLLV